ncbi:cellulase family glycosylhydrolase [Hymenobacter weizhouensis]|uniref:cellulase family glycosylhydrolase n=1 Tax=Hymenobacter sp. YIM 151500-1 TaxID=2987689 RepID=UPI002227F14C|nr:cellulase family glycosylhydrolase [Hymenobacter sp. YIM 151500-1]UYZ62046.1 cellulase family glycosylhydrolase [Hymenobacter sp. YIM 151500-1]
MGFLSAGAQNFTVQGPAIYDPAGQEFIPVGANVNAFNFQGWARVGHSAAERNTWRDCWKFNCLRANLYLYAPQWQGQTTDKPFFGNETEAFQHFDNLVNLYTPSKIVVMFEVHDFTGTWPTAAQQTDLKNFWKQMALRYKNNPYVWFNIMNEPGAEKPVPVRYRDIHRDVTQAIRDQGASNVIIVDGTQWGQEAHTWDDKPIPADHSGVLTYGPAIVSGFSNVAFNFHLYDQWVNNYTPKTTKYNDYVDRVRALNLSIFVGEVGSVDTEATKHATELAYAGLKSKKVGMLAWHYTGADEFKMTDGGSGNVLNNCIIPTNLTPLQGRFFWNATHQDGFGLGYQATTVASGNLVVNGGFENNLTAWSGSTGSVLVTTSNVRSGGGSKALAVANAGTWVHNSLSGYVPGQAYTISAWGKVAADGQRTIVGLKGSTGELQILTFTSTTYSQQQATLTVPAGTTWLQVFVYQPGAGTGYIDDISLTTSLGGILTARHATTRSTGSETLHAYPNPAHEQLTVQCRLCSSSLVELRLMDALGRLVRRQTHQPVASSGLHQHVLDTRGLPAGTYLLELRTANDTTNHLQRQVVLLQP